MDKYVALLRGINVGGHKKVPMPELRSTFERLGFQNVKTLLNTGNVVFESEKKQFNDIPDALEKAFGFNIHTIILPFDKMAEIVIKDPFRNIKLTPKIRRYVTFLSEKPATEMPIPFSTEDGAFKIIEISDTAVFSVLDLERTRTVEYMNILGKEFGDNITTRNYNTVVKIGNL